LKEELNIHNYPISFVYIYIFILITSFMIWLFCLRVCTKVESNEKEQEF